MLPIRFTALIRILRLFDASMIVTMLHTIIAIKCLKVSMSLKVAACFTYISCV